MTHTNKHLIEAYTSLFEGLSTTSKLELIESLAQSLQRDKPDQEASFYQSFGAFGSDKPAAEIAADIKASRQFRPKDIAF